MSDYQFEYRGLTMGLGTDYAITEIDGLEEDSVIIGDSSIPRNDGDIPGLHFAAGRQIEMTVVVRGDKGTQTHRDKVQALIDAFQHSESGTHKLLWQEPGFVARRFVYARPAGRAAQRDPRSPFYSTHKLRLKLSDPRAYREAQVISNLADYDPSGGGLDYAITEYGKDYAGTTGGELVLTNNGNAKAWPIIQFYGPTTGTITQVTLTNTTTGQAPQVFDTTITTGQILTADMDAIVTVRHGTGLHVVRLGTTNKFSEWAQPRDPFYLQPGDNIIRFEISGGTSTDGTCSISFRDTWL